MGMDRHAEVKSDMTKTELAARYDRVVASLQDALVGLWEIASERAPPNTKPRTEAYERVVSALAWALKESKPFRRGRGDV